MAAEHHPDHDGQRDKPCGDAQRVKPGECVEDRAEGVRLDREVLPRVLQHLVGEEQRAEHDRGDHQPERELPLPLFGGLHSICSTSRRHKHHQLPRGPASDWPAALLAVNATVVCRGANGDREIAARDFFLDTFTTAIEPTEVLVEVRFRLRPGCSAARYTKLERRVGDFATAGCRRDRAARRRRRRSPGPASA